MTTKAVILAQKSGEATDMILPHTSADLVGYEKENSTATNVREALDEINDNFQGEKPGIVARVEALENAPDPTPEEIGAANAAHTHSVNDLTGVLPVAKGGTGNATGKAPGAVYADSAGTANSAGAATTAARLQSGRRITVTTYQGPYGSGWTTFDGSRDISIRVPAPMTTVTSNCNCNCWG